MIDTITRQRSLDILRRIAIAMAEKNDDPILGDINILSESTFQGKPKSEAELDNENPVVTQDDGGYYYTHVRMDGRGQINIIWTNGVEITFKFLIPEKYLSDNNIRAKQPTSPTVHLDMQQEATSELDEAIKRLKEVDPDYPTSISKIPQFPFSDFRSMKSAIKSGRFMLSRFSFHQDLTILGLVSPSSIALYYTSIFASYLVPLICVILAFTVSSWFWFGLLYFVIGTKITTAIWKNSITQAAYNSESAFCLLFFTSKIHIYDLTKSIGYDWQKLQKMG